MTRGAPLVDVYAPLSHIPVVGDPNTARPSPWPGYSWVPADQRRRLAAYMVRDALLRNVRRWFLPDRVKPEIVAQYREYGDVALAVDRVVAGVLGTDWSIVVDGADDDLDDGPDLPDPPEDPGPDAPEPARRIYAARQARYDADAAAIVDEWIAAYEAQPALQERQEALRAWADDVHLAIKLPLFERNAAGLGDGLLVLWPGAQGEWPRLEVMDPDAYFPVLVEGAESDFPDKVHFAWEFVERNAAGVEERFVRRITFELVDLVADADDPDSARAPRPVPYSDTPATRTCLLSDGTWDLQDLGDDVNALDESRASWRVLADGSVLHRFDLRYDFISVVHRPGIPDGESHFGGAITDTAAQVLGDVAEIDSAVMGASAYLRKPALGLSGNREPTEVVAPGMIYGLGEGGRMDVLDLSKGTETLVDLSDRLQDRAWQSLRVPGEMVGKVDSSDVASGVTLALSMGPFGQTVDQSRAVGRPKHTLLLKMAQRMAQVSGALPPGPTPTARIAYGSYLPSDRKAAVEEVARALEAGAISTHTAVRMLVAVGFPIDDATAEVERIQAEDVEGVNTMADALAGHPDLLRFISERLGVEPPTEAPVVDLPRVGGET